MENNYLVSYNPELRSRLTGRFYFKMTQNGNLIGEFSNK